MIRIGFNVGLIFIILFAITAVTLRESGQDIETLNNGTKLMEERLFNLTEYDVPYVSPYENRSFKNFVINAVHGGLYAVFVEWNNLIGYTTNLAYEHLDKEMYDNIVKTAITLAVIWLIIIAIKPIVMIYLVIKDSRKKRKRKNET